MATGNKIMVKGILVINLGGFGDVLLSTPALRALKATYPQAEVSMLVSPRAREAIKDLSYIDRIHIFYIGYGGRINLGGIFKNLKTLMLLRKERFDLAINMRTLVSKRSALKIKFLLGIINPEIKAGRDTEGRGSFFDIKIPEKDFSEKYEMDYDIEMVRALGAELVDRNIDFKIDESSFKRVDQILENEGVSPEDILIGIHPGGMPSRRWPLENFSKAIDEISQKIDGRFIITGEKGDSPLARELKEINPNLKIIDVAGKLNIKELGAIITRCRVYITNDTGPMHLVAILKTPLIAIFGPGDIIRYDPRRISDKALVLYKKMDCAPCNRATCRARECLRVISPGEAAAVALRLIGRKE
jgi:heptosyltransferase-2